MVVFETKEKVQAKPMRILDFLYHLYPKTMKKKFLFKEPRKIYMQNDGTWYKLKAVVVIIILVFRGRRNIFY